MKNPPISLLVATTNAGKAREIAAAFRGFPVRVMTLSDLGIRGDFPETGKTFAENARAKALFYSGQCDLPTLAEDSGLIVEALGGEPGVRSARFSGPGATDEKNNRKLLRRLDGVPAAARGARFVCCMVLARRGQAIKQVTGRVRGRVLFAGRGRGGFGYDPLFFHRRSGRTFGELPPKIKNKISHRGRALALMKAFLQKNAGSIS